MLIQNCLQAAAYQDRQDSGENMANGNGALPIPGGQALSVILAAPTDILGLATRQVTETLNVFNVGIQRFGAAAAQPPVLPAGLPALPAGLPALPAGFPMFGQQSPSQPAPAAQAIGSQAGAASRRVSDRTIII